MLHSLVPLCHEKPFLAHRKKKLQAKNGLGYSNQIPRGLPSFPLMCVYLLFESGLGGFVVSGVHDHASQVKAVEPEINTRSFRYGGGEGVPQVLAVTLTLAVGGLFGVGNERWPQQDAHVSIRPTRHHAV